MCTPSPHGTRGCSHVGSDACAGSLAAGRRPASAAPWPPWWAAGGSVPRPVGTSMLVSESGEVLGSLSGGCVEGAVVAAALEVMADGGTRREFFGYSAEDAFAVGLTCGGELEVHIELLADTLGGLRPEGLATLDAHDPGAGLALIRRIDAGSPERPCSRGAPGPGRRRRRRHPGSGQLPGGAVRRRGRAARSSRRGPVPAAGGRRAARAPAEDRDHRGGAAGRGIRLLRRRGSGPARRRAHHPAGGEQAAGRPGCWCSAPTTSARPWCRPPGCSATT